MGTTLSAFKFKWGQLNDALNKIVDAVNRNAPLEGENVHLEEKGQQGVSINSTNAQPGDQGQQQDGSKSGQWMKVILFDVGGNPITMNVWTDKNKPGDTALLWDPITVVNPSDCSQSTVTVLTRPNQ